VTPRRGEVWRYDPVVYRRGVSVLRLIVSAEPINRDAALRVVLGVNVVDSDPGGLLAVAVDDLGWVSALTVQPIMRSRLLERIAIATPETMEQVGTALRAAQDL
jgi:mRNA-degrading endonuclease toxin of MazEF toxin-antitoxin module